MSEQRMTLPQHVYLSVNWFSINFLWGALLPVVIPAQVLALAGESSKEAYLSIVIAVGALVAMIAQPIVGALSDRTTSRLGRRRPYIMAGTVITVIAFLPMCFAPGLTILGRLISGIVVYLAGFIVLQIGSNLAASPYQGLIPDLVPESQRGTASGWMGLMTMLGTCIGAIASGLLVSAKQADAPGTVAFYVITTGVVVVGAVLTVWKVREERLREVAPFDLRRFLASFYVSPRQHPDFAWLFVTRFLVMIGFYTVLTYLQYYLKDVLGMANFTQATSSVSVMVMVGALASSLVAGWASDRVGRRPIVFVSGLLMALTCLIFILTRSFWVVLVFAVIFGLGYGAYISVDWALAVDVLPSIRTSAGKDLGIWSIAVTFPQVLAPVIGGPLLAGLKPYPGHVGYVALYLMGVLYFVLGSALIWKIRKAR